MTAPARRTAALAAICALLAAPFLLLHDAPLFDLPVHVARQHILYDAQVAIAREHYQVLWRVLPNLALDLFVGLFRFALPIDWAVRLFLAVTAVQLFLGAVALNRALFGGEARFGWIAALFVYSGPFLIGLINLCFGVGLCLLVFALSIRVKRFWPRFVLCGLLSILVLLSHLYAFALYGLLLGAHAFGEALPGPRDLRRRVAGFAASLAHLVVPAAFYLAVVPRGFNDFLPVSWEPHEKLWALVSIMGVYNLGFDLLCLLLLLYGLGLVRRHVVLAPAMRWPLAALALAFLALPYRIGQGTWVDERVPSTFMLVLAASLNWRGDGLARRVGEPIVAAMFLLRMGVMGVQWWAAQPVFADYRAALQLLEPGAKLLAIGNHPSQLATGEVPPLPHMDAIAVSERGAFIPSMLADRPYELLHYTPAAERLKAHYKADRSAIADYDAVLVVDPAANPLPPGTEPIYRGAGFILARVVH